MNAISVKEKTTIIELGNSQKKDKDKRRQEILALAISCARKHFCKEFFCRKLKIALLPEKWDGFFVVQFVEFSKYLKNYVLGGEGIYCFQYVLVRNKKCRIATSDEQELLDDWKWYYINRYKHAVMDSLIEDFGAYCTYAEKIANDSSTIIKDCWTNNLSSSEAAAKLWLIANK